MTTFPIDICIPELKKALAAGPVAVVQAPPGAGKTTRIPPALVSEPFCKEGRIVMLEPRRIAAVSAAGWMARSLGEKVGETVGYTIRFDSRVSDKTRIEVVTEGILARRIQKDPSLEGTSLVIFDEFHERSIHADLALALCLDIRKNLMEYLKILVMSATIDTGPIASLLGNAPVITSEGKQYPVEDRYIPDSPGRSLTEKIASSALTALREEAGDILIFLPGAGEIRSCTEALKQKIDSAHAQTALHPLYGDLPFGEQEAAILPSRKRKIVLATNIAETSLTIEGVRVVIDSGLTRRLQYDPARGMNRLITVSVSRASAEQRKGRAGRLGPGVCYRLYSRHAFQSMIPFAPAEILVSDLASVVLELAQWGVKNPSQLSWLDLPPAASWGSARNLLMSLGALDRTGAITPAGSAMARLPLHPRLSRMMVHGVETGNAGLAADLAALLSERDVVKRQGAREAAAARSRDIGMRLDMLSAWRKKEDIPGDADQWALRAVERTARQLRKLAVEIVSVKDSVGDRDTVSSLLLSAFPDRIAKLRDEGGGRFLLSSGREVRIPVQDSLAFSPFIVAANADAGEKSEGMVHLASALTEPVIRRECAWQIESLRTVSWDKRQKKVTGILEERIGAVTLSSRSFRPADEEALPILLEVIRSDPSLLSFSREASQFQSRVMLMRRTFPSDGWPDVTVQRLALEPEAFLPPWLQGLRSAEEIRKMDLLPALRAALPFDRLRLLDEQAPTHITVPSGNRIQIDYTCGDLPVLQVKLQEMFGLADTPTVAGGKVRVLVHLLSPARRPVQVTQDLRGFWERGYQQVKKELKGRYPKHPWPDDPWAALPTARTKKTGGRRSG